MKNVSKRASDEHNEGVIKIYINHNLKLQEYLGRSSSLLMLSTVIWSRAQVPVSKKITLDYYFQV